MSDFNAEAFLASVLAQPRLTAEESMVAMQNMRDQTIRDELNAPISEMGSRDLLYLRRLCDRSTPTALMIETLGEVNKVIADRLAARRDGPTFAPKTRVMVTAIDFSHNPACSAPLPIGVVGRVVEMIEPENDEQIGLVQVRFPPKPLGYSGQAHVSYVVPNTCLAAA